MSRILESAVRVLGRTATFFRMGVGVVMSATGCANAAETAEAVDKSGYTLFHPVPEQHLRELSTDRPDQTESPYTVDAGHIQVEMDAASFTYDRDTAGGANLRSRTWAVAPVNLKVGLSARVDVQLMLDTYMHSRLEDRVAGTVATASGFGDVTTRVKINVWGNDDGPSALAIMPFIKWPLAESGLRNGEVEGGIIVPYGRELALGWGMGAMTEIDFVSDGAGGHDTEWLNSITFGRDLLPGLGCYFEFVAVVGDADGFAWQGQFDFGLTVALGDNAQLDFGCNFGVTRSAPDFQPFVGFSRRY